MRGKVVSHRFALCREIPSRLEQVEDLCLEVRSVLHRHGLGAAQFAMELLTRECLNNAVLHGNGKDAAKRVALRLSCGRDWLHLRVVDEGAGFNWRAAGRRAPAGHEATNGRGLAIIRTYADRVSFNQRGNQITVWLRKQPSSRP